MLLLWVKIQHYKHYTLTNYLQEISLSCATAFFERLSSDYPCSKKGHHDRRFARGKTRTAQTVMRSMEVGSRDARQTGGVWSNGNDNRKCRTARNRYIQKACKIYTEDLTVLTQIWEDLRGKQPKQTKQQVKHVLTRNRRAPARDEWGSDGARGTDGRLPC